MSKILKKTNGGGGPSRDEVGGMPGEVIESTGANTRIKWSGRQSALAFDM